MPCPHQGKVLFLEDKYNSTFKAHAGKGGKKKTEREREKKKKKEKGKKWDKPIRTHKGLITKEEE